MMKKMYAIGLIIALMGLGISTTRAAEGDSIDIVVEISNQISVDIDNTGFTITGQAMGADYILAQSEVLSIDNSSSEDSTGFIESYSLSAELTAPAGWNLEETDATPEVDEMVILAVFSQDGSDVPASGQFNSAAGVDDLVLETSATAASDTMYYGTGPATGNSGLSVSPAADAERNLWLRIKLPTTSTEAPGNAEFTLYISASQG